MIEVPVPPWKQPTLLLWVVLLLLFGGTSTPANDLFASRAVLTGNLFGDDVSAGGTTAGAGSQNEVDEKMEPAPANQASVWYEWVVPRTWTWRVRASFSSTATSAALAAYVLPAGASGMNQMEPAGACLTPVSGSVSLCLNAKKDQRVIIRVWTLNTAPASQRSFSLLIEFTPPLPSIEDPPEHTYFLSSGTTYTASTSVDFRYLTTEPLDTRLENGRWAPAVAADWLRWKVPSGPAHLWQLSLMPDSNTAGRCEILRPHPSQTGRYQALTPPGTALQFTPVPGETLYIRASTTVPWHTLDGTRFHFYLHHPCEIDERDGTAPPLLPGSERQIYLHGATPGAVPLPVESLFTLGMPDVWIPLGGLETGVRYNLVYSSIGSSVTRVQLYDSGTDGALRAVAEGSDLAFTAESGRTCFVRIVVFTPWIDTLSDLRGYLYFRQLAAPAPVNDHPAGAIVIRDVMTDPLSGDLRGATASPEEATVYSGDPPALTVSPAFRTVWYALDLPASPHRVGVTAWGNGVTLYKPGPGDSLTVIPAPPDIFGKLTWQPDGSRIYARVQGGADRFLFLVVPVSLAGDERHSPIPINTGETSRYFPNWATQEADDGLPDHIRFGSTWHVWTPVETGRYHVSTVGSVDYSTAAGQPLVIYRAVDGTVVTPVASPFLYLPGTGDVTVIDATAGETYLFRSGVPRSGTGPAFLCITPAAGASPYTFWRQSRPAWDDVLADPFADPDGDGVNNLWEMATGGHPGRLSSPLGSTVPLAPPSAPGVQVYPPNIYHSVITGPTGCTPFVFTVERSSDLISWLSFPRSSGGFTLLATDPLKYYRFRLTR